MSAPPQHQPPPATYPALPVDALLADQADLIQRIRLCFGLAREDFDGTVLPLIRRHAAQVHLLPATADNHFSRPGGLLQLGLETAFFSLQGTDGHIVSGRATISERRHLEPRWRLATFIAGLCSELHRTVNRLQVSDAAAPVAGATSDDHATHWPAVLTPLTDWLTAQGFHHYRIRWRHDAVECRGLGLFVLLHVVPPGLLQHLADGNDVVVPHLLASVGGIPLLRAHNVLDALVRRSLALVIDRDLRAQAHTTGRTIPGEHVARLLVQAMQRLASTAASWQPNAAKSRLWWGSDGLYLLWPQAANDIRALLDADQLAGMPADADAVLQALTAADVLDKPADGSALTVIRLPGSKATMQAVRLASPELLTAFAPDGAEPLALPLGVSPRVAVAPPADAPPPPKTPDAERPPADDAAAQMAPTPGSGRLESPNTAGQSDLFAADGLHPDAEGTAPPPQHLHRHGPRKGPHGTADARTKPPPPAGQQSGPGPAALQSPAPPAAAPARTALRVQAPMRLNLVVRDALTGIVAAVSDGSGAALATTHPEGLFIALAAFQAHGVSPEQAVRALADAGMLAGEAPDAATAGTPLAGLILTIDLNGTPTQGLVVAARWINGLAAVTAAAAGAGPRPE